ncbi:uncharacterized protein LOC135499040 [Lineus longissimus]|uniref:uncharacterized protein LOC135499040 n=1 Tax=Lineus longissimus TaxID=88925 RepID=UPI00315DC14C
MGRVTARVVIRTWTMPATKRLRNTRDSVGKRRRTDARISAQGEIERQNSADRKSGNNPTNTEHGKNKSEPDSENIGKERPVSGQTAARNQKEKLVKEHTRSYSDGGAVFVSPRRQRSDSNGQHSDQGIYDNEHAEVVLSRSRSLKYDRQGSRADFPPRLLVVSSKIKNIMSLQNALLPQVTFLQYKFETSTFDGLIGLIGQFLLNKKFHSVALVLHGPVGVIQLCGKEEKPLNKDTVLDHAGIRGFFSKLFSLHGNKEAANLRLDFLACNAAQGQDGGQGIVKELEALLGVSVGLSRDIVGAELVKDPSSKSTVGELYFRLECLRGWSGHYQQSMAGFEKIRTVGKGAYGAAVLYRKRDDDSLVILKEINMHDLNAAERQLALNEVKVLAVLDHPNIISYYDSFEEDGVLMIEMEYANGGTLAQYLSHRDAPLDEKEILEIFQQMVAAIRHIHEHNILHRDMKTANIFLTKEGVVKVGDFGISKIMSTADKGANTVMGTPYYISPEMCEGKEYNGKSDIWALGCILYEMACLQKTFEGSNLPALVNKIMKGQFAPVKGNYSEDFKNLIKDMLEREPEYRPSANELMYRRLPEKMSTTPQQRKIYKFTMVKDVALLKEIVAINPFSEPSKWKEVLQNFNFYFTGEGQEKKDATERGIVDRFAVLLTKFKKDELTSVRVKLSRRRKQVKTYLILVIIRGRLHLKDLVPNHDLASDFNFIEVEDQEVIPELKHHYKTRSGPELPVDDFLPDLGGDVDAPDSELSTRASIRQESSISTATTSGQTSRSRRQASSLFTDTNSSTMALAASTPAGGEVVLEMRDFAGGPDIEMDDTVVIAEQLWN